MSIQVARILTPCSVCSKRIGNPMKTKELLNITTILCLFTLLWVYNNLVMKLKQLQRFFFCQRLHLPQRNEFQNCQVGLILSDGKIISTGFDAALYFMHSTEKNYKTIKISPLINSNRHTKWPLPRAAFVSLADRNFPRVSSVQIFYINTSPGILVACKKRLQFACFTQKYAFNFRAKVAFFSTLNQAEK